MNKTELIDAVAEETLLTKKQAQAAVDAVIGQITKSLTKGDSVSLVGFGKFEVRHRDGRTARNPQTGKDVLVPPRKVPAFKPGATLKDSVN